jgi:hypothetical protein
MRGAEFYDDFSKPLTRYYEITSSICAIARRKTGCITRSRARQTGIAAPPPSPVPHPSRWGGQPPDQRLSSAVRGLKPIEILQKIRSILPLDGPKEG